MQQLIQVFENLSADVWIRIRNGINLGVSQGEETISDIVLLDLVASDINRIYTIKTPKHLERNKGTDWEWWIGSDQMGWIRYAVQAKKLNKKNRYPNLTHKHSDGELQIDILERYSVANQAVPLYCFYNFCKIADLQNYWNCCYQFDELQLGCTITPSFVARQAIQTYGKKNFRFIHSDTHSLPWRCLVACPNLNTLYDQANRRQQSHAMAVDKFGQKIHIHESIPNFLAQPNDNEAITEEINNFYSPDIDILPKRIMAIEISTDNDVPLEHNIVMD